MEQFLKELTGAEKGLVDDFMHRVEKAKRKHKEERSLPIIPLSFTHPLMLGMQVALQREKWEKQNQDRQLFGFRETYIGNEIFSSPHQLSALSPSM